MLLPFTAGTGSSLISAGRILHESGQDEDSSGVSVPADDIAAATDGPKQGAVSRKIGRGPLVKKAEESFHTSLESERPSQLTVIPGEGLVITTIGEGDSSLSGAQQAALGNGEATSVAEKEKATASISAMTISDDGDLGAGGFIAEDDPDAERHAAESMAAMMYRGMMMGTDEGAQPMDNQDLFPQTKALPSSVSADATSQTSLSGVQEAGSVEADEEGPQENNEILVSVRGVDGREEILHVIEKDVAGDSSVTSGSDSATGSSQENGDGSRLVAEGARSSGRFEEVSREEASEESSALGSEAELAASKQHSGNDKVLQSSMGEAVSEAGVVVSEQQSDEAELVTSTEDGADAAVADVVVGTAEPKTELESSTASVGASTTGLDDNSQEESNLIDSREDSDVGFETIAASVRETDGTGGEVLVAGGDSTHDEMSGTERTGGAVPDQEGAVGTTANELPPGDAVSDARNRADGEAAGQEATAGIAGETAELQLVASSGGNAVTV